MYIIHCSAEDPMNVPLWECGGQQFILATVTPALPGRASATQFWFPYRNERHVARLSGLFLRIADNAYFMLTPYFLILSTNSNFFKSSICMCGNGASWSLCPCTTSFYSSELEVRVLNRGYNQSRQVGWSQSHTPIWAELYDFIL